MNRRKFILSSSSLMGLMVVGEFPGMRLLARADGGPVTPGTKKKFFVLIRAQFGWDVTLGLDPQVMPAGCDENDIFIEYRPEDILSNQSGSLRLAPAAAAMMPYANSMAIINGVFMSDSNVDHGRNLNYATAGTPNDGAPSLAIDVASHSDVGRFGVIFDQDLSSGDNPTVMTTTFNNLQSLASGGSLGAIRSFLTGLGGNDAYAKAQATFLNGDKEIGELKKALAAKQANANQNQSSSQSQSASNGFLAACGFASGCANQAQITIQENLDTHSDHPVNHMKAQTSVWTQIAAICELFKSVPVGTDGSSVFDQTTFMVVSEFSRTPALDASKGKNHNPLTNSVLLLGNGVRGGQVAGKSHLISRTRTTDGASRHVASLYNYQTGAVAQTRVEATQKEFDFIRPENIAATVRQIAGATPSDATHLPISRILK